MNYLRFNDKQEPILHTIDIKFECFDYLISLVECHPYSIDSVGNYTKFNNKLPYIIFYDDGDIDLEHIPPNKMYIIDGIEFYSPIIVKLSPIGRILYKNGGFIGYDYCFTSMTSKDIKQIEKHITKCN